METERPLHLHQALHQDLYGDYHHWFQHVHIHQGAQVQSISSPMVKRPTKVSKSAVKRVVTFPVVAEPTSSSPIASPIASDMLHGDGKMIVGSSPNNTAPIVDAPFIASNEGHQLVVYSLTQPALVKTLV